MKQSEFARTRLLQEFELIFKEYAKAIDIENKKSTLPFQRLQHHDPQKWKKKFKMLFDREKIVDFGLPHKKQIDLRKLSYDITRPLRPMKQLG